MVKTAQLTTEGEIIAQYLVHLRDQCEQVEKVQTFEELRDSVASCLTHIIASEVEMASYYLSGRSSKPEKRRAMAAQIMARVDEIRRARQVQEVI